MQYNTPQHFFTQRIVARWNSLPAEVAEAPSLNAFKNRVDLFMRDYMYNLEELPTNIRSGKLAIRILIISDSATGYRDLIYMPIFLSYLYL